MATSPSLRGALFALCLVGGVSIATPGRAADFSAWTNSLRITFSGYTGRSAALTNFPVLVKLSETGIVGFDYDNVPREPEKPDAVQFSSYDGREGIVRK